MPSRTEMVIYDDDLVPFLQWSLPQLGRKWSGYRKVRGQVKGRLKMRLRELELPDLDAYRTYLQKNAEEWEVLDDFCRITISRFYRGQRTFDELRRVVLPALAKQAMRAGRENLRAWCIGSASGEEVYSLRLCWDLDVGLRFPELELEIIGVDAGETMVERARAACYPGGSLRELPEGWVERAFEESGDGDDPYCVRQEFRRNIVFYVQDLREEQPAGPFDLVFCRYILFIYFDEPTQRALLSKITDVMAPGAAFVLGPHEELFGGAPFEPWFEEEKIYRLCGKRD